MIKAYPRNTYKVIGSDPQGLNDEEVKKRLEKYGKNELAKKKGKSVFLVFIENFISPMAILLWISGLISLISAFIPTGEEVGGLVKDEGMLYLAIAIWLVNIINGVFSFVQQNKANKATDALANMLPSYSRVIRNGQEIQIESSELVPGDIVVLSEGDKISADCRILMSNDLSVNQSAFTGEVNPVRKSFEPYLKDWERETSVPNLIFAGTSVSSGQAKALVYDTGMNTQFGKIASLTTSIKPKVSHLDKELSHVTTIVSMTATLIGLVVFILGVVIQGLRTPSGFSNPRLYLKQFIIALGMVVAFIPEGLLPIVTLSLAKAVQRMSKEHALVKSLSSVETLGSTTVICSDKTGTLTKNEMTVKSLYLYGRELLVGGDGYEAKGEIKDEKGNVCSSLKDEDLKLLLTIGGLCNNSRLVPPDLKKDNPRWTVLGDPTEACLLVSAKKGLVEPSNQANLYPRIRELTFDSVRKLMTTIHQLELPMNGCSRIAFTKGAPLELLNRCNFVLDHGKKRSLTEEDKRKFLAQNDKYAKEGLRVLGMAFRLLGKEDGLPVALSEYKSENVEKNMTFVGLEAMQDPPREEIYAAVKECHRAGIKIIMVTGDYGLTALSIARKIGIVQGNDPKVVTGSELAKLSDGELDEILKGEIIFARMAPEQKYRVVSELQKLGETVAVTGDGVNDAPALKKADIGVAMGITGTDVAKDAADMILTDDNFASIVKAVREGRAVFDNIRKFILYIFNSNVPEGIPFLLPLFSGGFVPQALTIMQVLAIDLGTDMAPALGLGGELPQESIMDRPPRKKEERILTKNLLVKAFLDYGLINTVLSLGVFFLCLLFLFQTNGISWDALPTLNVDYPSIWMSATAATFAAIVFGQIGAVFNCRTDKESVFKIGIFSNKSINIGVLVEVLVVLLVVFVPWVNEMIFESNAVTDWRIWLIILLIPFVIVALEEGRKWLLRENDKKRLALRKD